MTPTFSTKQYKKLAEFLANTTHARRRVREAGCDIAEPLADMMQADNIKFNRKKFFATVLKLSYPETVT